MKKIGWRNFLYGKIRSFYVRKKRNLGAKLTKKVWLDLINSVAWLYIVISTAVLNGTNNLGLYVAAFVMMGARLWPTSATNFSAFRKKRRIRTTTVLGEIDGIIQNSSEAKPEKIQSIRRRVLDCIVESVRDEFGDTEGTKIYANLLVRKKEKIIVIARNSPAKVEGTEYNAKDLQCNKVFDERKPIAVGNAKEVTDRDIQIDYNSFMALPVIDVPNRTCHAVVTVDSIELHHFDETYSNFETMLGPYLRTLAITFTLEKQLLDAGHE
jgi:hypothetical protein